MKIFFCFLLLMFFSNISLFTQCPFDDCINDGLFKSTAYEIWTIEHLYELGDSINKQLWPYYSHWHFGKHFRLMSNIDTVKQPIGIISFMGHLYGNGKTITITNSLSFFWGVEGGGSIDSLTVEGYTDGVAGIAGYYIGPAHYMNLHPASVVSNCTSNVTINAIHNIAGGIAFYNRGTVINCVNNGSIEGENRIGGIVGSNDGTVNNCLNTGRITATNSGTNMSAGQPTSNNGIGGIVGHTASGLKSISNNINTGTIEGQGMVGGIVGTAYTVLFAPITNNTNYGFVKGINRVGGIVGWIFNAAATVSNNSNFGVVVGEEDTGCIVGKNSGGNISNNHYDKQMCGE